MGTMFESEVANASTEQVRTFMRKKNFARVARLLWPSKTADQLAFRAGVGKRTAEYWLQGKRVPTSRAILAVISELTE